MGVRWDEPGQFSNFIVDAKFSLSFSVTLWSTAGHHFLCHFCSSQFSYVWPSSPCLFCRHSTLFSPVFSKLWPVFAFPVAFLFSLPLLLFGGWNLLVYLLGSSMFNWVSSFHFQSENSFFLMHSQFYCLFIFFVFFLIF